MEPERPLPPVQPRAPPTTAPVSPPRIADATDAPAAAEEHVATIAKAAAAKAAAPAVPLVQTPPAAVAAAAAQPPKTPTHEAAAAAPTKQEAAEGQAHATGNGVGATKDAAAPVAVTTRVLRLANMVRCSSSHPIRLLRSAFRDPLAHCECLVLDRDTAYIHKLCSIWNVYANLGAHQSGPVPKISFPYYLVSSAYEVLTTVSSVVTSMLCFTKLR